MMYDYRMYTTANAKASGLCTCGQRIVGYGDSERDAVDDMFEKIENHKKSRVHKLLINDYLKKEDNEGR